MKKILLALLIVCISTGANAQKKKIAILETTCIENNIQSNYLRMICSNIETGIVKNPEYIAYNRNQVANILKEHNFQRSGLVDDSEIRAMGKMAGVDYVLTSEAVLVDDELFVSAKVLNVESGRYEMSANELMKFEPQQIKEGCDRLAETLLNNGKENPATIRKMKSASSAIIVARTGLTAYWTFDDGTGKDVTGNGYDGKTVGNIAFITDSPSGDGKSIQFRGDGNSNRYIYTQERISTSIFTVAFWIKDFGPGNLFKLYKENDYFVNFCVTTSSHEFNIYSEKRQQGSSPARKSHGFDVSASGLFNSGWHHIVVSVNMGYMQLFVDGELVDQGDGYYIKGDTKLYFGAGGPVMKMDNVRIYNNYILSSEEVKEIYNAEL